MSACHRCERALAPGEERRVPRPVVLLFSSALAFLHAGLWFQDDLSRPYCRRCRALVVAVAVALAALVLGAASVGVALLLRGPRG